MYRRKLYDLTFNINDVISLYIYAVCTYWIMIMVLIPIRHPLVCIAPFHLSVRSDPPAVPPPQPLDSKEHEKSSSKSLDPPLTSVALNFQSFLPTVSAKIEQIDLWRFMEVLFSIFYAAFTIRWYRIVIIKWSIPDKQDVWNLYIMSCANSASHGYKRLIFTVPNLVSFGT